MKNTRFIPSNSITFHNELCSYNIVLLGNNAVLLTKTENGDISILISKEILQNFACGKVLEIGTFSGQKCGVIEVEENFDIDNNLFEVITISLVVHFNVAWGKKATIGTNLSKDIFNNL